MRIAIVADRVGWEERQLLTAAADRGAQAFWLDDARLCAGPAARGVPGADAYLMRSRSYTRGGPLAALLADAGRMVVNSPEAIAACQDKLTTARLLAAAGLPVPDFRLVLTRHDLPAALDVLGLPCVLKPLFGGLGRRVLLIRDADLADAAYDYVEHFGHGFDRVLLAQRYHPGTDERVLVAGGRAVAAYQRVASGDWRANVALGARALPSQADGTGALAVRAATAVGAVICAVDLLAGPGGAVVNEVNHVPMFRGAAEATGADIGRAVIEALLAEPALGRHGQVTPGQQSQAHRPARERP